MKGDRVRVLLVIVDLRHTRFFCPCFGGGVGGGVGVFCSCVLASTAGPHLKYTEESAFDAVGKKTPSQARRRAAEAGS